MDRASPNRAQQYRIEVQGRLDGRWSGWFAGMSLTVRDDEAGAPVTSLVGHLPDQAALRAVLERVWSLNLCLLSVARVEAGVDCSDDAASPEGGMAS